METKRVCKICGVEKPIGSFYRVNASKYHWKMCKECWQEKRKAERKESDAIKIAQREAIAEQARIPSPAEVAISEAKARESVGRRKLKPYEEYIAEDDFFHKRMGVIN